MFLMHKDIPVADIEISGTGGILSARVLNREHMPIGTHSEYQNLVVLRLQQWMKTRTIPEGRQERKRIEDALGCSVSNAMLKAMGVSLTDCYWFRDIRFGQLSWEDVNYHTNGFSHETIPVILYGADTRIVDFRSPDYTTDGILKKAWVVASGVPSLIKFGDFGDNAGGKNLLSANEVAAGRLAEKMGVHHAEYFPVRIISTGETVCVTPCFIHNTDEEFVSAHQIADEHRVGGEDLYRFFAEAGMKEEVDQMIVFDHIIHNTDRHERNFGIIRNPDTLKIRGFAPLFDSGSSFGWNYSRERKDMGETKPFCGSRTIQLGLACLDGIRIPEEEVTVDILRGVYKEFQLPERNFQIARNDISKSYNTLRLIEKEKSAEEDLER